MRHWLRSFRKDERGAIALMFGLALVPLAGFTGAAIDYARASQLRQKMSAAADAAVLVAAKSGHITEAQRRAAADAAFAANLGTDPNLSGINGQLIKVGDGWRYEVTANYKFAVIQVIPGMGAKVQIRVFAEAIAGEGRVEVALVLDNTGSMVNDMAALRKAATEFTNILFDTAGGASDLRMSLVPYVAAVNPGRLNLGMTAVDARGDGPHQAANLRERWIAFMPSCNNNPNPPPPGPPGPPGPPPPGPGTPGQGTWLQDAWRKFGSVGQELFGVNSAAAQVGTYGTPNRTAPLSGGTITVSPPFTPSPTNALVPTGFNYWTQNPCVLGNPSKIANLDLFDGIRLKNGSRAQWKGCVEARPEPFDVTDDPPNPADPRTLFTPYFWPDEPGKGDDGNSMGYVNNYMDDGPVPNGWGEGGEWERQANLFKYNGQDQNAKINDNPPNTSGPNMACPDELLRLTNNRSTVLNKIKDLRHWNGGGTISSEGIAWGWRTLSPNRPFADGAAYDKAKKYLVVMTDGMNEVGGNNIHGPVMSHYNAYGYMRWGRFGAENFDVARNYLDNRMSLVCENAKAKGVQVITIMFRVENTSIRQRLENCASNKQLFFPAKDQAELERAFREIAQQIGRLRLTR
jgi:Flp pilus assembly protein TadG